MRYHFWVMLSDVTIDAESLEKNCFTAFAEISLGKGSWYVAINEQQIKGR